MQIVMVEYLFSKRKAFGLISGNIKIIKLRVELIQNE